MAQHAGALRLRHFISSFAPTRHSLWKTLLPPKHNLYTVPPPPLAGSSVMKLEEQCNSTASMLICWFGLTIADLWNCMHPCGSPKPAVLQTFTGAGPGSPGFAVAQLPTCHSFTHENVTDSSTQAQVVSFCRHDAIAYFTSCGVSNRAVLPAPQAAPAPLSKLMHCKSQ